jgi:hypothetical protein
MLERHRDGHDDPVGGLALRGGAVERRVGLGPGAPPRNGPTARWWRGRGRWSPAQPWAALRAELWDPGEFRPVWHGTLDTWPEMADSAAAQTNARLSASLT